MNALPQPLSKPVAAPVKRPVDARVAEVEALLRLMRLSDTAQKRLEANTPTDGTHDLLSRAKFEAQRLSVAVAERLVALEPLDQQRLIRDLAQADWASPALIVSLCRLPVETSAPLLRYSPVLEASSLIQLLHDGDEARSRLIAQRRDLGPEVIDALIDKASDGLSLSLLNNTDASLNATHMARLCAQAQSQIALRAPLVRHARLSASDAARLAGFVGPRLKADLVQRFGVLQTDTESDPPRRALSRLQVLGRLQHGDMDGFCQRLAEATGETRPFVRHALANDSGVPLALMLVVLGIDRAAFDDILSQIQALNGGHPKASSAHLRLLRPIFDLNADEAQARLKAMTPALNAFTV